MRYLSEFLKEEIEKLRTSSLLLCCAKNMLLKIGALSTAQTPALTEKRSFHMVPKYTLVDAY